MDRCENSSGATVSDGALDKKLAGIDLNLLVALEMLLHYRNVTHAARRLGQAQPTVSRALARLRDLLGDDLLVRGANGMKLTARGEHLATIVPTAMSHVRDVLSSRQSASSVRISIGATLMPALLPHFIQWTSRENDPLKINMHKFPEDGVAALRTKTAQFILGSASQDDLRESDIEREVLVREDFVTLVSFDTHRLGGIRPCRETFMELSHVNLVENGKELFAQVAHSLLTAGVSRSRLIDIPDVTAAALMAAENGFALTVPRAIAGWLTKTLHLSALVPPIEIAAHEIELCWHRDRPQAECGRLVTEIGNATREAIARDQAAIRTVRLLPADG
ncbi:LysR family transcriptional regulator [Rhizobium puerariae]|uniref:LysR family transcriptional regulator n=1 Tax=Rhizobium puerariae TaxID=1585791 RepID=A0ABV6AMN3_9HYPH